MWEARSMSRFLCLELQERAVDRVPRKGGVLEHGQLRVPGRLFRHSKGGFEGAGPSKQRVIVREFTIFPSKCVIISKLSLS